MAFDLFAREPSIDVFCGGWGAAVIDATPQPANKQKRKIRFIRPPFVRGSTIDISRMTMSTSTKDTLSPLVAEHTATRTAAQFELRTTPGRFYKGESQEKILRQLESGPGATVPSK